jgi:hypothetical protein
MLAVGGKNVSADVLRPMYPHTKVNSPKLKSINAWQDLGSFQYRQKPIPGGSGLAAPEAHIGGFG